MPDSGGSGIIKINYLTRHYDFEKGNLRIFSTFPVMIAISNLIIKKEEI
jgi:hypothetical protein